MAVTGYIYHNLPYYMFTGQYSNFIGQNTVFKCALFTDLADLSGWDNKGDFTDEVSGTGYATGGVALGNPWLTTLAFDANDIAWAGATISDIRYAVIYDDTPASDVDKKVICYFDFGENLSPSGETFTLAVDATGLIVMAI